MLRTALTALVRALPAPAAEAHCDGPCGVYDPASARVAAEAVLSMTKKLKAMEAPAAGDAAALAAYNNTFSRYVAIKEEESQKTKKELLILWTDYRPSIWPPSQSARHLESCQTLQRLQGQRDQAKAEELMSSVEKIHGMFWQSKGRSDAWVTAS